MFQQVFNVRSNYHKMTRKAAEDGLKSQSEHVFPNVNLTTRGYMQTEISV